MKLIVIPTLLLGLLIGKSLGAADPSLCNGLANGAQIPNNNDCASYYVCNYGVPKLFECKSNTLYDIKLKVCNWADSVTCGQIIAPPLPPILPPVEVLPLPIPPVFDGHEYYPGVIELYSTPGMFACNRDGFYYAPHPYSCEQYFICENNRIHTHQCGHGIHWDYVLAQCDYPLLSKCFSNSNDSPSSPALTTVGAEIPNITNTPVPGANSDLVPECPGDQAFYANLEDCHKYYICIGGLPISTTCPDNMVWDSNASACGPEETTRCLPFKATK